MSGCSPCGKMRDAAGASRSPSGSNSTPSASGSSKSVRRRLQTATSESFSTRNSPGTALPTSLRLAPSTAAAMSRSASAPAPEQDERPNAQTSTRATRRDRGADMGGRAGEEESRHETIGVNPFSSLPSSHEPTVRARRGPRAGRSPTRCSRTRPQRRRPAGRPPRFRRPGSTGPVPRAGPGSRPSPRLPATRARTPGRRPPRRRCRRSRGWRRPTRAASAGGSCRPRSS